MEIEELRDYVKKCIVILFDRILKYPDGFGFESHIHADLYVLLNTLEHKFWENFAIEMGTEGNFKGSDIAVYDPDKDEEETQPDIRIEIKYFNNKKGVIEDLEKLKDYPNPIFIYVKRKFLEVVSFDFLKKQSIKYPKVRIYFLTIGKGESYSINEGTADLLKCGNLIPHMEN